MFVLVLMAPHVVEIVRNVEHLHGKVTELSISLLTPACLVFGLCFRLFSFWSSASDRDKDKAHFRRDQPY